MNPFARLFSCLLLGAASTADFAAGPANLENPQPAQPVSGVGVISGWVCNATRVEISFDGAAPLVVPYGSSRDDTAPTCGRSNTGFGYLLYWNLLSPGVHTIRASADGVEFANRIFTVVSLGTTWIPEKGQGAQVNDFPLVGQRATLQWQAATQSFIVKDVKFDAPSLKGRWNGADLERRSGCRAPENDGNHGTYAQYQIDFADSFFNMQESGVTGLTCSYTGTSKQEGTVFNASGNYSCSDGKTGSFSLDSVIVTDREMSMQLTAKLTGTETCSIDKTLGGSRY